MKEQIKRLLAQNDWKCNAAGRAFIANQVTLPEPREIPDDWQRVMEYAEKIGGCAPGEEYQYINAQNGISTAKVYGLYDIPKNLVNPFLVCFSGMMTAHLYTMEALRFHFKKTEEMLPIFCTGKEGNKGLFKDVFEREDGLMVKTEAEAYLRLLSLLAPSSFVRQYERAVADTDTHGNFDEMYELAKFLGLKEATFLLCSGNFSYDKRLLAEGMLQLRNPKYADVKFNLAIVHCPICLYLAVPEGHPSELMKGYVAASLGPLMKDTLPLALNETSSQGERYLMPGVAEADWSVFKNLIMSYSNMGWPNYQEILYGVPHEEAVVNIILSDLYARASFTVPMYDESLLDDIQTYQSFVGRYEQGTDFAEFLKNTPDTKFFG